jgi:hypothetical protein
MIILPPSPGVVDLNHHAQLQRAFLTSLLKSLQTVVFSGMHDLSETEFNCSGSLGDLQSI